MGTRSQMPARLVLLLFISLTTVFAQFGEHVRNDEILIGKDELRNKEVLGIASGDGIIAVATKINIFFFTNTEERRFAGNISIGMKDRERLLEFKVFSKSEVFFCDESNCQLCTYSDRSSNCATYKISEDEEIAEVLSAAVVKLHTMGQLLLTISFIDREDTARMMYLKYNAQDTGDMYPISSTSEPVFITNNVAVSGFEKDNFVYFVTAATQVFEPDLLLYRTTNHHITTTKVVRFCAGDQSEELASKIVIHVGCDRETKNITSFAEAATFDASTDLLDIMTYNTNTAGHLMCRFKLSQLYKRFEDVWDTCQEVPFEESSQKRTRCENPKLWSSLLKKSECLIYSRIEKEKMPAYCFKYGRDEKSENCNLHLVKSQAYQFGWLEDYSVFQGELMMKIPADRRIPNITSMIKDGKGYFVSLSTGSRPTEIMRISPSKSVELQVTWITQTELGEKFSMSNYLNNHVLFDTKEGIRNLAVTCKDLFKSCEELSNGGWDDPLDCSWCADKSMAIGPEEHSGCHNILKHSCPPKVQYIYKYTNRTGFTAHGNNFKTLANPVIVACGTNCSVVHHEDSNMQCETIAEELLDNDCETVLLNGNIGGKYYSFPVDSPKSDMGTQTDPKSVFASDGQKGDSPSWKIALAILSVLLLIFVVVVIVYFMRNRLPQIKPHVRQQFGMSAIGNDYIPGHGSGRSAQIVQMNGDNYVNIFRCLPVDMKIDFKYLRIDRNVTLGQGHYGVVYPATYTYPKGTETPVVCKQLKGGRVSEFYDEAKTMSQFSHPNILKMFGVALDDVSHLPVIVTEAMVNGDLKTYIENGENVIKMRELFNFAIEIANGMEYIHSKNFIHRDLAARNCLLDGNLTVKIADFGLCRKIDEETQIYAPMSDRDLPIRWFPPEIVEQLFSTYSDVWSYGVVIWELFTRGQVPYKNMSTSYLLNWLKESEVHRLPRPPYCPDKLYTDVMLACWRAVPESRPKFHQLAETLQETIAYMEVKDRSQLNAGYERVSSICLKLPLRGQASHIYQNELTSEQRPLLNRSRPSDEIFPSYINTPSTSTSTPSSINNDYEFISDCAETRC